ALVDLLLHAHAADQLAAAGEGPLMVRADDGADAALGLVAQDGAAVGAEVVEGADLPVVAAEHEQRIGVDAERAIVARIRDLACGPCEDPAVPPDALQLVLIERGVVIEGARQAIAFLSLGYQSPDVPGDSVRSVNHRGAHIRAPSRISPPPRNAP